MTDRKHDNLHTMFAQAGGAIDLPTGGVVPPIQPSTTFVRDEGYVPFSDDHIYARDQNDLTRLGERLLSQAEGAEDGLLFPTGMAAVAAAVRTVANGGTIVLQSGIYWGTTKWVRDFCARRDVTLVEVDCADLEALQTAAEPLDRIDLLWIETPSNPYLKTVDIAACAEIAHARGGVLLVDATAATPVLSQPLAHGADMVMHSATKGINGHSDVLAGFLGVRDAASAVWDAIKIDRQCAGAILGSFEAWLLIRGMRTMPLRVEHMSSSAMKIAQTMAGHERVETVLYPGLETDPGHALAQRQMPGGFGSLLSIVLKGNREQALAAVGRMSLFKRATSLGGVESLVEHRHTIEDTVPDTLLRLSVGIENVDDLIADLHHALDGHGQA